LLLCLIDNVFNRPTLTICNCGSNSDWFMTDSGCNCDYDSDTILQLKTMSAYVTTVCDSVSNFDCICLYCTVLCLWVSLCVCIFCSSCHWVECLSFPRKNFLFAKLSLLLVSLKWTVERIRF